jgi:hypothetical protein
MTIRCFARERRADRTARDLEMGQEPVPDDACCRRARADRRRAPADVLVRRPRIRITRELLAPSRRPGSGPSVVESRIIAVKCRAERLASGEDGTRAQILQAIRDTAIGVRIPAPRIRGVSSLRFWPEAHRPSEREISS